MGGQLAFSVLLYDHACGNACYPFAMIASAFGGIQVLCTNCGGLWHRTRADGFANPHAHIN